MNELKISDIEKNLESGDLETYHTTIDEICGFIDKLNSILLKDFRQKHDLVKADTLNKYLSLTSSRIKSELQDEPSKDIKFYLLMFLYVSGDKSFIPKLLDYAEGNNIEQSLQVINKLAEEGVPELLPILKKKLEYPNFDEPDYLAALLQASSKMKLKLPETFTDKIPPNAPWNLKTILKEDFGLDPH